jgi:hypothetical protein
MIAWCTYVPLLEMGAVGSERRTLRWAVYVARMGDRDVHIGFWWGDLREGDHLEDPGVDGRIILKRIFKKWDGGHGLD